MDANPSQPASVSILSPATVADPEQLRSNLLLLCQECAKAGHDRPILVDLRNMTSLAFPILQVLLAARRHHPEICLVGWPSSVMEQLRRCGIAEILIDAREHG